MSKLKLKLKKIDPVKYALITGILMALMGFIVIGITTLFSTLIGAGSGDMGAFATIMGGGLLALIFIPVLYFIFGFIFGLIGTMLLNFVLKKIGGLPIDFEKTGTDISMIGEE
ncbi:hypothetical protein [uncultured Tenacibaculum sp.]|uniref:hypothetical protein n=1 Tax=uncultured Tenacibaculum sp. TaxID=174713 RepID=UPI0026089A61|nr:hypothetical protein [uncultured Tenacibaculum sp.]